MTKKTIGTLGLLMGISFMLSAQSRALPILELNADIRTAAMGDAFMATTKSMYLYSNPTSLLNEEGKFYTSYSLGLYPKFENSSKAFHAVSAGYKFDKQALMIGFRYLNDYPIRPIGEDLVEQNEVHPMDWTVDIAYSHSFSERVSAFLGGSVIQSHKFKTVYTGAINGGVYYQNEMTEKANGGKYTLGLSFLNVGGKIKYRKNDSNATSLPSSIALGGSMDMPLSEGHNISAALTAHYFILPTDAAEFTVGAGGEYELFRLVAFRAGYHYGKTLSFATFGTGVSYKFFKIDAAYQTGNYKLFRIGFSALF